MPYVLQMEYRCEACDRALCQHCFVVVDRAGGRLIVGCRDCDADMESA